MAFNFFGGGSSIPSFNTAPLLNDIQSSAERRKQLITGLTSSLKAPSDIYSKSQGAAGQNFAAANTAAAKAYQEGLKGLGAENTAANTEAIRSAKEQAYRNIPQQQQAIRESLGATGQLRTGAAGAYIAQPLIQASQNIADLTSKLTQQGLNLADARREAGVTALYNSAEGNALTQLGIDRDTANVLLQTGRQDLISQAADLIGLDKDTLNATLGVETVGQEVNIARAQQNQARKGALLAGLGSLGGAAIGGAFGGLPGASLGSNVGASAGNVLAGLS